MAWYSHVGIAAMPIASDDSLRGGHDRSCAHFNPQRELAASMVHHPAFANLRIPSESHQPALSHSRPLQALSRGSCLFGASQPKRTSFNINMATRPSWPRSTWCATTWTRHTRKRWACKRDCSSKGCPYTESQSSASLKPRVAQPGNPVS